MLLSVKETVCECPRVRNSLFRVCPFHLVGVLVRYFQCSFVWLTSSRMRHNFAFVAKICNNAYVLCIVKNWANQINGWGMYVSLITMGSLPLSLSFPPIFSANLVERGDVNHNVSRGTSHVTKIYTIHMFCIHCCHQFWFSCFHHRETPQMVAKFGSY